MTSIAEGLQPCPINLSHPEDCSNTDLVEVEQDGDCVAFECPHCGYSWGHTLVATTEDACQIGVPESVRRAGSAGSTPQNLGMPTIRK